jgi:hypothetical protein
MRFRLFLSQYDEDGNPVEGSDEEGGGAPPGSAAASTSGGKGGGMGSGGDRRRAAAAAKGGKGGGGGGGGYDVIEEKVANVRMSEEIENTSTFCSQLPQSFSPSPAALGHPLPVALHRRCARLFLPCPPTLSSCF